MKHQINLIIIFIISFVVFSEAQTASDAIRFSNSNFGGTARTIGLGGAYGALGADFGSLSINPAGLGVYRSDEFVFSMGYYNASISGDLLGAGKEFTELSQKFIFPNIGYVSNSYLEGGSWKVLNFGIGYNNLSRYHRRTYYEGITKGSMSESFVELGNGQSGLDSLSVEGMAYNTWVIDDTAEDGTYDNLYNGDEDIFKSHFIVQEGYSSEIIFSVGANYEEKLMLGATVGIPIYRYKYDATYKEEYSNENNTSFVNFEYNDYYETTGWGKNLKVGAIYTPSRSIRIGLSAQTPTLVKLSDTYSRNMNSSFLNPPNLPYNTGYNYNQNYYDGYDGRTFDYKLRTPGSLTGSFAYLFGKKGLISIDAETKNYAKARYIYENEYRDYEVVVNQEITSKYKRAYNIRMGGEYVQDKFRVRVGLAMYGSPFKDDNSFNNFLTGGLGYRGDNMYIDFAIKNQIVKEGYRPYELENKDLRQDVDVTGNKIDYVLTVGFKF